MYIANGAAKGCSGAFTIMLAVLANKCYVF
jgi:hypothetical protein